MRPQTKTQYIKELKQEIEILQEKLKYEREIKNVYKTFWTDINKYINKIHAT
tara:strand:+ start:221 stop:376 length:156 start_codon:yes stop_codon:yes gene_type:complete